MTYPEAKQDILNGAQTLVVGLFWLTIIGLVLTWTGIKLALNEARSFAIEVWEVVSK